ncbi:GntR family transcriptional regulator [Okibacterium endophyticum]
MASVRASDRAYEALKEDILQWRLAPGAVLAENEQSARLGISRTPLREAITRLAAEGLVHVTRGRAGVVTGVSPASLIELFELREALETQAARLAARRRDAAVFEGLRGDLLSTTRDVAENATAASVDAYYSLVSRLDAAIAQAMASAHLLGALNRMSGHLARARRFAHNNPLRLAESVGEHLLIVDAIIARDETLAAQATAVHLRKSLSNLLETIGTETAPHSQPEGTA